MTELKGKRVLIFQQRGWALTIGNFLAQKLHKEGCELAALTFKRSTHEFIQKQDTPYKIILNNDEVMNDPKTYLAGEIYPLEEICADLGIDSIWPIVQSLRNHVKSYGDKYYYGHKQNISDEGIIDYVMAVYKYTKFFFKEFDPEVIIAPNFVALPHIIFNLYAEKRGVEMITVTDSKIRGINIFSLRYLDDKGLFYDRVDDLNSGKIESHNIDKAKKYIIDFREKFIKPAYHKDTNENTSWYSGLRHALSPYRQIFLWLLHAPKNELNTIGVTADYRTPYYILRDHYVFDKNKKFVEKLRYYPLERIKKFVYFPLQFQPESSIDVMASHFNNQIETARLVAMSLPGDYTLVVKEHPAMIGLRPSSYTEKIRRTVNVKLIDYRIPGETVLKKASLVISPNSTTLAEAAFLNKPAIQLGNLGTTLRLPNVQKHTDMTTLTKKIKEVLQTPLNTEKYERHLENYVAAAYDTGFDMEYNKIWEEGTENKKRMELLWDTYKKEIVRCLDK